MSINRRPTVSFFFLSHDQKEHSPNLLLYVALFRGAVPRIMDPLAMYHAAYQASKPGFGSARPLAQREAPLPSLSEQQYQLRIAQHYHQQQAYGALHYQQQQQHVAHAGSMDAHAQYLQM